MCVMSPNWGPATLLCLGSFVQKWSHTREQLIRETQSLVLPPVAPKWCCLSRRWQEIPHTELLKGCPPLGILRSRHMLPYSHRVDDKRQNQPVPCGMSRPHPWHCEPEAVKKKKNPKQKQSWLDSFTEGNVKMHSLRSVDLKSALLSIHKSKKKTKILTSEITVI